MACLRTTDRFLYLCLFSVVFSSLFFSILRLSTDLYAFNLLFVALPVTTMRRRGNRRCMELQRSWTNQNEEDDEEKVDSFLSSNRTRCIHCQRVDKFQATQTTITHRVLEMNAPLAGTYWVVSCAWPPQLCPYPPPPPACHDKIIMYMWPIWHGRRLQLFCQLPTANCKLGLCVRSLSHVQGRSFPAISIRY